MNTHRIHKKNAKQHTCLKRRMIMLSIIVIASFLWIFAGSGRVSAHDNNYSDANHRKKCYKSIEIASGDTLWNIAETYMDDDYDCVQAYIKELKEINGLCSDNISAGKYLMVPYYDIL